MKSIISRADRFHSLDALRGVAALAVVFWHWQHFALIGPVVQVFERKQQPLYDFFRIFYDTGWLAVDLFFSLSGFIFFWLYSQRISSHTMTLTRFFILRFSRLYPLHIATLLFVAIGQIIYITINGHGYVYENTNLWHFILNLFLLSSIGFEKGYSFNGPAWSVSVEGLLYIIFFAFCKIRLNKPFALIITSLIGFTLLYQIYSPISRGIGSFFLGGITYIIFEIINKRPESRIITIITVFATVLLWLATLVYFYFDIALNDLPVLWRLSGILPLERFAEILLFPMSILSLALFESKFQPRVPGLELLGSISYSTYLLHFPVQLVFALLLPAVGELNTFFQTGASMILVFFVLISLSLASYKYMEMPAQHYIRKRWLMGRPS